MSGGHGHGHGHGRARGRGQGHLARGGGSGRILFLDAQSGVAGDMVVAALIDLGVPLSTIQVSLDALSLRGFHVALVDRVRSGIAARGFEVHVEGEHPERSYGEIRALIAEAALPEGAKDIALDAFRRLAEAEALVHGAAVDEVSFHEVGAVDSIVDVVAAATAFDHLGARVVSAPLPMGRGTVRARHGVLPLPAPATVYCLRDVPTYDGGVDAELVTPTGACLVAAVAQEFARWPAMKPERVGFGAGTRELADRANVLRVVLGEPAAEEVRVAEPFVVLETNVDDTTAEIVAHAVDAMMAGGALDAWTTPIGMKKGRPATMISALARRENADAVARVLLSETSTLGIRVRGVDRIERPRRIVTVETPFGRIPVKIADGDGLPAHVAPELEPCRAAARTHGVPLKTVYASALHAARPLTTDR